MRRSFLVSVGSVKIPVYGLSSGRWCLSFYQDGQRKRETRATREEATKRAEEVATAIHGQKASGLTLTGADRDSYARSLEVLKPFGVTLHDAVEAYTKARHRLQKASLNEAVDFYIRHNPTTLPAKTVKEISSELLDAKKRDRVSAAYLKDLNTRLPRIAGEKQHRWLNYDTHMTYIEQFEVEFAKKLDSAEDTAPIVRWTSEKVLESYRNGITAGQKGVQVIRKGKSRRRGFPAEAK